MINDISFCGNVKCERKDCRRHLTNTPKEGIYSMCTFNERESGENCEWYWKMPTPPQLKLNKEERRIWFF